MGNVGGRYVFEANPVFFESVASLAVYVRENLIRRKITSCIWYMQERPNYKFDLMICGIVFNSSFLFS